MSGVWIVLGLAVFGVIAKTIGWSDARARDPISDLSAVAGLPNNILTNDGVAIIQRAFSERLFYRLNVIHLIVPANAALVIPDASMVNV